MEIYYYYLFHTFIKSYNAVNIHVLVEPIHHPSSCLFKVTYPLMYSSILTLKHFHHFFQFSVYYITLYHILYSKE